ncbi:hypothetical protein BGZ80_000761 [Entomortierella chlamydospora]|uniref:Ser-Thr-rich glycosyl-phosphatidyl-inositol-anchored membrane family-domain-containing protein n=1 Tax=Entomortierella chlamydospora TaxID=101097 RepID=A0A9P6MSM8_9FUNG|nr:hypothetical protein BGZ80_000761 [Entomortierella chlamydospora]
MRFSAAALTASLIGAVMAQTTTISVNVTHPIASDTWTVGKSATVSWVANVALPNNGNVSVELFHGDPTHQTLVQALGSGISQLKVAAVPTVPADWYSVRINSDSYSHYFFIANATVTAPATPEPGTATTTTVTTALPTTTTVSSTPTANATTTTTTATSKPTSAGNMVSAGSLAMGAREEGLGGFK